MISVANNQLYGERRGTIGRGVETTRQRIDDGARRVRSGRELRATRRAAANGSGRTMTHEGAAASFMGWGFIVRVTIGSRRFLGVGMTGDGRMGRCPGRGMRAGHSGHTGLSDQRLQQ